MKKRRRQQNESHWRLIKNSFQIKFKAIWCCEHVNLHFIKAIKDAVNLRSQLLTNWITKKKSNHSHSGSHLSQHYYCLALFHSYSQLCHQYYKEIALINWKNCSRVCFFEVDKKKIPLIITLITQSENTKSDQLFLIFFYLIHQSPRLFQLLSVKFSSTKH